MNEPIDSDSLPHSYLAIGTQNNIGRRRKKRVNLLTDQSCKQRASDWCTTANIASLEPIASGLFSLRRKNEEKHLQTELTYKVDLDHNAFANNVT